MCPTSVKPVWDLLVVVRFTSLVKAGMAAAQFPTAPRKSGHVQDRRDDASCHHNWQLPLLLPPKQFECLKRAGGGVALFSAQHNRYAGHRWVGGNNGKAAAAFRRRAAAPALRPRARIEACPARHGLLAAALFRNSLRGADPDRGADPAGAASRAGSTSY